MTEITRTVKSALYAAFTAKGVRVSATSPEWAQAKSLVVQGHTPKAAVRLVLGTQDEATQATRKSRKTTQAPARRERVFTSGANVVTRDGGRVTFRQEATPPGTPTPPTPPVEDEFTPVTPEQVLADVAAWPPADQWDDTRPQVMRKTQRLSSQAVAVKEGRVLRDAKGRIVSREIADMFAELSR